MKIEIDVEIPTGYRFLRYGRVKRGEYWLKGTTVCKWLAQESTSEYVVVEAEQQYREPSMPGELCEVDVGGGFIEQDHWFVGKTRAGAFVVEASNGGVYTYRHGCRSKVLKANDAECKQLAEGVIEACRAEYRDVNRSDVGKEIEVSDEHTESTGKGWTKGVLSHWPVDGTTLYPTVCGGRWLYARVRVSPDEPVKTKINAGRFIGPEYRDVELCDVGSEVEVTSGDGVQWRTHKLKGILSYSLECPFVTDNGDWRFRRIRVKPEYREATADDVGRQVEVSDRPDFTVRARKGALCKDRGLGYSHRFELEDGEGWTFCRIKN